MPGTDALAYFAMLSLIKNKFYTIDNSCAKNIRKEEQSLNVEKLNNLHDLGAWISIHKTSFDNLTIIYNQEYLNGRESAINRALDWAAPIPVKS